MPGKVVLPGAEIAPRLIDHLLNELGDRFDRLPVLQHALLRTWDEWQRAGGVGPIDLRHFESAGGLEGALNQDAERALEGLDIGVTARVFKRLTDTDLRQRRVRSPARISELMAAASTDRGTVEKIVRRFEEGGRSFVHTSADGKPDDPRVDISHESLIRQWDRLRNWVDEERWSRDQYKDLVARARRKAQGKASLLQDPELQTMIDWKATVTPSSGWAQRYSSADGDFESADRYLVESVEVRYRNLAEAELQRRWEKPWSWLWLIVMLEVVVGILLAEEEVVKTLAKYWGPIIQSVTDLIVLLIHGIIGDTEGMADGIRPPKWFVRLSLLTWIVILYVGACDVANRYARQVHRRVTFPRILKGVVSSGGQNPTEAKAGGRAPGRRGRAQGDLRLHCATCRWLLDRLLFATRHRGVRPQSRPRSRRGLAIGYRARRGHHRSCDIRLFPRL